MLPTKQQSLFDAHEGLGKKIQDSIVREEYVALLDDANKLYKKLFKDPLPYIVRRDPPYQRLACYPIDVQTFLEPILYMAGIVDHWAHNPLEHVIVHHGESINFVVAGDDKDLSFITRDPTKGDHGFRSPYVSMNNDLVKSLPAQLLAFKNPSQFVENMADYEVTKTEERQFVAVGSFGIANRVMNRKESSLYWEENMDVGAKRHGNWTDKVKLDCQDITTAQLPVTKTLSSWDDLGFTKPALHMIEFSARNKMGDIDINTLTMEHYLALTRGNEALGVVKPEIGSNVNLKIKS
ncbi:hypothetical protein Tco_0016879 [Tanacetum coccineum]